MYVGGNAFLMTFASWWISAPRLAMVCFPAYGRLAELTSGSHARTWLLLGVSSALAVVNGYAWGSGWWVA